MNKKFSRLFLFILIVTRLSVFGQTFPLDDAGKIVFYEVVKADSFKRDFLYHNAVTWLNSLKGFDEIITESLDSIHGKIIAKNEVTVYSQTGILKKISGKMKYQTMIEVKDNLYRYNFSEFVFHYYKQDRNYKMVATGKTKNLEDAKASGWQKLWDKHRSKMLEKIQRDIAQLKIKIVEVPVDATKELAKKKEVKWEE